ncbi:response regulator [Bradyrhizobium sp. McL0616]|uniref:response regulator n=1 Tax=Bradyrhizobium sp. McL0616 TaxID=3415674 RepID=UPI003CEE681C
MRTIAVVENDPSMLQSLSQLLAAHGFQVATFASAEAFLAGHGPSRASCLLLDIDLDGLSGIDLQRRLISSGVNLPVIFMTANDDEIIRRNALNVGCVAYLTKPFSAKLLIDAINGVADLIEP